MFFAGKKIQDNARASSLATVPVKRLGGLNEKWCAIENYIKFGRIYWKNGELNAKKLAKRHHATTEMP